jgi:hypothetical protein
MRTPRWVRPNHLHTLMAADGLQCAMRPRTALALSVAFAVAAVALVAVDIRFSLEARLDAADATGWRTVSRSDPGHRVAEPHFGCAPPQLRLVVTNDRLLASEVPVRVTVHGPGGETVLLQETWRLQRGEQRQWEFTVPPSTFETPPTQPTRDPDGFRPTASANAQVGGIWLHACVQEAAA